MNTCSLCRARFDGPRCPTCGTAAPAESRRVQRTTSAGHATHTWDAEPDDGAVRGTVVQTQGPVAGPPPPNYWKRGSILLAVVAFLPVVFFVWLVLFSVRLVFSLAGLGRHHAGGRSLWDELVYFHSSGARLRPPEPIPVYHHIVQGRSGRRVVRQEGEFRQGCLFVGNDVRLECTRRAGNLVVRRGYNETLSTPIACPGNPWKFLFGVMLLATVLLYAGLTA